MLKILPFAVAAALSSIVPASASDWRCDETDYNGMTQYQGGMSPRAVNELDLCKANAQRALESTSEKSPSSSHDSRL